MILSVSGEIAKLVAKDGKIDALGVARAAMSMLARVAVSILARIAVSRLANVVVVWMASRETGKAVESTGSSAPCVIVWLIVEGRRNRRLMSVPQRYATFFLMSIPQRHATVPLELLTSRLPRYVISLFKRLAAIFLVAFAHLVFLL